MERTEKILVLDANQRSALAVTRSLGKAGLYVICADESKNTLAGSSKYSSDSVTYPSPYSRPDEFITRLADTIKNQGIQYLLPMTDITAEVTLKNKSMLGEVSILLPDAQAYLSVSDKYELLEMSLNMGIPVPETLFFKNLTDLKHNIDSIIYPVVIKPNRSIVTSGGQSRKTSVRYAMNMRELLGVIEEFSSIKEAKFLVQKYVEGHGEGLFVLCKDGVIMQYFSHKRLREKPPSGGVSVLSESIETREENLETAKKILGPLKWNGVAMVEFKVTKNNQPYLMEVNGRFWGSLQLAIDSGVNFPFLLYNQFSVNPKHIPEYEYREGIQLRWLLGDIDNLIITLKDSDNSLLRKIKSITTFLRLYRRNQFYEVNRASDLKPAIYELFNYFN